MKSLPLFISWVHVLLFLLFSLISCKTELRKAEDSNLFPYHEDVGGLFEKDVKVGYMNNKGQKIIAPLFYGAQSFTDGLGIVETYGNKFGYIDSSGKFIIPPKFDRGRSFKNSRAWVWQYSSDSTKSGYGLINKKGQYITPRLFSHNSTDFYGDYCYGYIFKRIEKPALLDIFITGILSLGTEQPQNIRIYDFYKISMDGDTTLIPRKSYIAGVVETNSRIVINDIEHLRSYHDRSLCGYKIHYFTPTNKFQHLDQNSTAYLDEGFIHIKAQFKSCDCFTNGFARVQLVSGESAYIDTEGDVLFTFKDDRQNNKHRF